MLKREVALKVLEKSLSLGADFADLFIEKHLRNNIRLLDGKVKEIANGIDFGIGIRLIYGTKVVYGYTNSESEDELLRITGLLAAQDRRDPTTTQVPLNFSTINNLHNVQYGLNQDINVEEKISYLKKIDLAARAHHQKIKEVDASAMQRFQQIEIFNTHGLHVEDSRHYTRIISNVIAEDLESQSSGYSAPGALSGWEMTAKIDPKQLGEESAKQAMTKLYAQDCPAGKMPVIIDNAFGGVIFHEACGHALETTSVSKKASVFWDKKDEMIASECVSAVDDGTLENAWGSINIDDEGTKTQRTQLIKNGRLENFMCDYVGYLKTGHKMTGSSRRQNYRFAPTSRMRNTFIEAGKSSLDEMIASVDFGIYAKKMGGGSVTPGTGEFNFASQEAYLIKNGKITTPLKSATLIGTGQSVLKNITMVGNNLQLAAGMCGSVSGAVPTTVGQPAIKVENILVGGQNV